MMNWPSFGIGTLHFGSSIDKDDCKKIVHKALDLGANFFDTSPLYGNCLSEEILGEILSEVRQPVLVATKVGLEVAKRKDGHFGVEIIRLTRKNLFESVEKSLTRLKRESIDLLMLHAFDPHTALSETLDALIQLHQEGKIQSFGCSNYNPQQLKMLIKEVKHKKSPLFSAAQCHYNMVERRAERLFIPLCETNQVRVVINRALARGALSGQYTIPGAYPEHSRASKSWRVRKWLEPGRLNLLEELSTLSAKQGLPLAETALLWLKKIHPNSIPLIGARNIEQLSQCIKSANLLLDDRLFKEIEALLNKDPNVHRSPPRYFEK